MAVVMTCFRGLGEAATVPNSARLSASVPPLVNTISLGFAPISAATDSRAASTAARARCPGGWTEPALPKILAEKRQHGFEDRGVHGSGRVVIKIDAHRRARRKRVCAPP